MTEFRRLELGTGVTLNVALDGPGDGAPVIMLHGFPESHRTWRELAPRLNHRFRLIMPDLRGYGASDRPREVNAYRTDALVGDVLALARALSIERFAIVGHDFGGVIGWIAAQQHADRVERLAVINAPHPVIFQRSLFTSPEQRKASQYIHLLRAPGTARLLRSDLDRFFQTAIADHVDGTRILEADRQQYLAEWAQPRALEAMLNWYRASPAVVPPPGAGLPVPDALLALAPKIRVPVCVVWGMRDHALLPVQLDGLDRIAEQLSIVTLADAGHWAPWEAPDPVAQALQPFLAGEAEASAGTK